MITAALKDEILNSIVENIPDMNGGFDINEIAEGHKISTGVADAILNDFEMRGFVEIERMIGGEVLCFIKIKAHDFISRGGYHFEETIASLELEKLTLEIESIYKHIPEAKYTRIMNTITTIVAVLSLGKK